MFRGLNRDGLIQDGHSLQDLSQFRHVDTGRTWLGLNGLEPCGAILQVTWLFLDQKTLDFVEFLPNLAGGESLVRQVLFGKRFIKREFGLDCKVLWMPDTFGFSWVIPQLLKKSGMEYFACSSIHWSKFNRFPYDTFHWRGMDGSEVLATFFTTPGETVKNHYNYNGVATPYQVKTAWEHYRQKDGNTELLMPFGWEDGGGGPQRR